MQPDHYTLQKLLITYQSVVFVYPTYAKAQRAFQEALSFPLTPEPYYFPDLLSIIGLKKPNTRDETIIRFMSYDTTPEHIRGMKAVICFPMGQSGGRYHTLWKEAAQLHERFNRHA